MSLQKKNLILLSVCVAMLLGIDIRSSALAIPIILPPDLNPGDTYRLVFVTSERRDATSNDINIYNDFVQTIATGLPELDNLGLIWTAMASTPSVNARDNTGTDPSPIGDTGVPIYKLNGIRVVDNYDDLWDGSIDNPININELGNLLEDSVWTGTGPDGLAESGIALSDSAVIIGATSSVRVSWVSVDTDVQSALHHLYAVSGELDVSASSPIPEPTTILLLGSGVVGLAVFGRKKKLFSTLTRTCAKKNQN